MRIVLIISGALLIVVGLIFFFQGISVIPGSFMTGQMKWARNGAIMIIVGIVLIILSRSGKFS